MPCSLNENVAITDFSLYSIQLKVMEEEWKGRREKKKGDKDDEGRRGVKEGTKPDYLLPQIIFHTGTDQWACDHSKLSHIDYEDDRNLKLMNS